MKSKSRSTCIAFILGPPGGVGKGGNLRLLKLTLLLLACACPGLPGEGGSLVDALHPTGEAMELAGLRQIARASADRLDHAREVIRIEHIVMAEKV